jgi:ribonuclease HII
MVTTRSKRRRVSFEDVVSPPPSRERLHKRARRNSDDTIEEHGRRTGVTSRIQKRHTLAASRRATSRAPRPKAAAKATAKTKTKSNAKATSNAKSKANAKTKSRTKSKTKAKAKATATAKTKAKAKAKAKATTKAKTKTTTTTKTKAATKTTAATKTKATVRRSSRVRRQRAENVPSTANAPSAGGAKAATKTTTGLSRTWEARAAKRGFTCVAGVDEAGRGPLAGPVVAAACVVPEDVQIEGIDDSKKLNEAARERIFEALTAHPRVRFGVAVVPASRIDEINILQAAMEGMRLAVQRLEGAEDRGASGRHLPPQSPRRVGYPRAEDPARVGAGPRPDFVFVDGNRDPTKVPGPTDEHERQLKLLAKASDPVSRRALQQLRQRGPTERTYRGSFGVAERELVVKGDSKVFCIAAASVIAKVTRDRIMERLHEEWPQYGFRDHKGYPTASHKAAVARHGLCPVHRTTFAPCRYMTEKQRRFRP